MQDGLKSKEKRLLSLLSMILSVSLTSPGGNTWYLSNSFSGISKGYLWTGSFDINRAKSPSCLYPTEL